MTSIVRTPTQEGTCSLNGLSIRHFSGEIELRRRRFNYICELHGNGPGRTAWLALLLRARRSGYVPPCAWVSVRSRIMDGSARRELTDPSESPLQAREDLRGLAGIEPAEVLARPKVRFFIGAIADLVLRDREVYEFLICSSTVVTSEGQR